MTTDYIDLVKQFQAMVQHPQHAKVVDLRALKDLRFELGNKQIITGNDWLFSRIALMQEELSEYGRAVAINDNVGAADALADLLVFIFGTAAFHGFPIDKVFEIVMEANMNKSLLCPKCCGTGRKGAKLKECSICKEIGKLPCPECNGTGSFVVYDEDGKVQKPESWKSPEERINACLENG